LKDNNLSDYGGKVTTVGDNKATKIHLHFGVSIGVGVEPAAQPPGNQF
jgi:hypothetical protein